jgi:hypothetical protein
MALRESLTGQGGSTRCHLYYGFDAQPVAFFTIVGFWKRFPSAPLSSTLWRCEVTQIALYEFWLWGRVQ